MSTALYRRYRPDTFADVIGQEHVTAPLMAAIDSGRINHAYLFSGPRGCGKTTSARILARCLNCEQGPTSTPCGQCASCTELARGGAGSIDVIEMDAASHGGVDDARDLRERALFAPVRDRFKVFIIDEAHMVTTQGFNALLKLVEEPPAHVKFVFATTEPEKVIGTIRSRTHHYPFRLVPPEQLLGYLSHLAEVENVRVEDGVLPLVVRAGTGSVRDSLSVLDQLVAGAENGVVSYDRAVALLGFTPGTLLDDAAEALAARDGAGLFAVVERVVESGHAPRRFTEDLLERLRDLIVVLAAGDSAGAVLPAVPADQLERMRTQARNLGAATCSRAADLVHSALAEMAGATSPRLQLELLCARLLLPSGDDGVAALGARVEYLEGVTVAGGPAAAGAPATAPAAAPAHDERPAAAPTSAPQAPAATRQPEEPAAEPQPVEPAAEPASAAAPAPEPTPAAEEPAAPAEVQPQQPMTGSRSAQPAAAAPAPATAGLNVAGVRQRWDDVLQTLAQIKRVTWALVSQNAQVVDLTDTTLTLGFATGGLATTFRTGPHSEPVAQALAETLGLQVRIDVSILGDDGGSGGPRRGGGSGGPGASGGHGGGHSGPSRQPGHGGPGGQGPQGGRATGGSGDATSSDAVSRASADWGLAAGAVAAVSPAEATSSAPSVDVEGAHTTQARAAVAVIDRPAPHEQAAGTAPADPSPSPIDDDPRSAGEAPVWPAPAAPAAASAPQAADAWPGPGAGEPSVADADVWSAGGAGDADSVGSAGSPASVGSLGSVPSPGSADSPASVGSPASPRSPDSAPEPPVGEPSVPSVPSGPAGPSGPGGPSAPPVPPVSRAPAATGASVRRAPNPADTWDAAPPWDDEPPFDPYDDYSTSADPNGGEHLVGAPLVAKLLGGTVIDEITLDVEG